jgi:bis(5'-nucleosyl)-tetraphosphatase (symmetrical)
MATYCIGDIHGCFTQLQGLLNLFKYKPNRDSLWFTGDLVNRGLQSLEVLRFVKGLPNVKIVLGNHDLHLLVLYHKAVKFDVHNLNEILKAVDVAELIEWLKLQPLIYYDHDHQCALAHAGIYPTWTLEQAQSYAKEVDLKDLHHLYGNLPDSWNDELVGWDRHRFIINAFTRMRFCSHHGQLEFNCTGAADDAPPGYVPWFEIPRTQDIKIVFGHWAALRGKTNQPNAIAVDTGCAWGRYLTAYRLEDGKRFCYGC